MALYDAFISYSHAKDKAVAAALQGVIQKLGRPWYRRRALRVFRDDTSLAAAPELWPAIEQALGESRYLIVLASPQLAASRWCGMEVAYWLEHKSLDTLLVALTDGALVWDEAAGDFQWDETTPIPSALKGAFRGEPKWIDLRAYRERPEARDPQFINGAADLAAAIHGIPKDDLLSQEMRQQRRALTLAWAAAASLLVLAGAVAWQWWEADRARQTATAQQRIAETERDRAQNNYATAKESADTVLFDIIGKLRDEEGIRPQTYREILEIAQKMMEALAKADPDDPHLQRSRAGMWAAFVNFHLDQGDLPRAREAAEAGLTIIRRLYAMRPDNFVWQGDVAISLEKLGDVHFAAGDLPAARAAYEESLAIRRELVARFAQAKYGRHQMSLSLAKLGDLYLAQGDLAKSLAAFKEGATIMRALVAEEPDNMVWLAALARRLYGIGLAHSAADNVAAALAAFEESLAAMRRVAAAAPRTGTQRDVIQRLHQVGDMRLRLDNRAEALSVYEEAVAISRTLAAADPNLQLGQIFLVVSLYKLSTVADPARARAALREALTIVERLEREGRLATDQRNWPQLFRDALAKLPPEEGDKG